MSTSLGCRLVSLSIARRRTFEDDLFDAEQAQEQPLSLCELGDVVGRYAEVTRHVPERLPGARQIPGERPSGTPR
ncbi:MAG: hypothetical protein M3235_07715 [Actinomycetota bacterium]|nr:hypothetical protein [Actinomycetota bacterium]